MGIFILIFSILIGLVCFWAGVKMIRLYFKVKSWEKVNATVISKKIELHKRISTRNSPYAVRVEYKYMYDNCEYLNNMVYMAELISGQVNHMRSRAEKKIKEIGNEIEICVDPKDPQQSIIYRTGIGAYVFMLFMGILSILIGLANI